MARDKLVNHIALVLDESASMKNLAPTLIKVADELIAYLARRSDELAQETRVSVYTFAQRARCIVWDTDVLRLPSIAEFYRPNGWTALIDGTLLAISDHQTEISQKYGDHAMLIYVLTDGAENQSRHTAKHLVDALNLLNSNWTVATLVPDNAALRSAQHWGFPSGNIAIWDATSAEGVVSVGSVVTQATENYMVSRSTGVRSTTNLFDNSAATLNPQTVAAANLTPLDPSKFLLLPIIRKMAISDFVREHGHVYRTGRAYYELRKLETIQGNKDIAIRDKKTNLVYSGAAARSLLNLTTTTVRVRPSDNQDYTVFVQSQSHNRNLIPPSKGASTQLLLLL